MTNSEFKKHLEENGGSVAEIEKITSTYDIEEVEKIIDAASNPEEAFKNIKKQFPEFDADKAISQMQEIQKQLEIAAEAKPGAPMQLNTEELNMVVGGSIFDSGWWSDNWKRVAKAVGCAVIGAVIFGASGAFIGGDVAGAPGAIAGGIICGVIGAVAGAYYGWNCI